VTPALRPPLAPKGAQEKQLGSKHLLCKHGQLITWPDPECMAACLKPLVCLNSSREPDLKILCPEIHQRAGAAT